MTPKVLPGSMISLSIKMIPIMTNREMNGKYDHTVISSSFAY